MCTDRAPDEVVVCDVALPDVRALAGTLPGVVLTHLPHEGTRVENLGGTDTAAFRAAVQTAISRHGGALPT
ncbi:MAG: hypothetical protein Q8R60_02450 [Mycobacteriales bacterium]|nr:hypothetical protein [Mycobacteriales bacterium]